MISSMKQYISSLCRSGAKIYMPVSGPVLCEKAVQLHKQLHEGSTVPSFQASRGWLWRFCNRHGIRQLSLQGEKVSSNTSCIEPFKEELQQLLERESLTLEQLYNCDETGLCYRMLPNKTLASQSEKEASGIKKQKDRVTLMACSNATGTHKLPLVFIGKAANPRCFKNMNKKALPVNYYSQKNAWVNIDIFLDWFHNLFVPSVTKHMQEMGLGAKALLLLDNAPTHPAATNLVSKEGNIKAMYLPPNTTALFQPMDQGVLEAFKRSYRKALLQKLLLEDQEGRSIIDFVKKIMKDVVYMTAAAWDDLPSLTLARSWNKLLCIGDITEQSSSTVPIESDQAGSATKCEDLARQLDSNLQDEDIREWMNGDSDDLGYQLLSDYDIIQHVTQQNELTKEDEEDDCEESDIPSAIEVKDMLDKCLVWYERQEESTSTSLLLLKRIYET